MRFQLKLVFSVRLENVLAEKNVVACSRLKLMAASKEGMSTCKEKKKKKSISVVLVTKSKKVTS